MGIFRRKDSINIDDVYFDFDPTKRGYSPYINGVPIDVNNLKLKDKRLVLEKQAETIARLKSRMAKYKELGYGFQSFEYLGPVTGSMSPEMETFLKDLASEDDVLLGIHRLKSGTRSDAIEKILSDGLLMTGHANAFLGLQLSNSSEQNAVLSDVHQIKTSDLSSISLDANVSYYPDNKTIIKELMHADAYEHALGSILIRIPDEDLKSNIYIEKEGKVYLNPQYIVGYVPLKNGNHVDEIITAEQLKQDKLD